MSDQVVERDHGDDDDEATLAQLGYTQSLDRAWSSFSNFAISFTIISVLAGCFTTYFIAWNNGGPIAISWGWPIICGLILLVAFSMSELVSKYPTAGGIYYWASDLGGNGLGLVHGLVQPHRPGRRCRFRRLRVSSVRERAARPLRPGPRLRQLRRRGACPCAKRSCCSSFSWALHSLINIYSSPLVAMFNNISVGGTSRASR